MTTSKVQFIIDNINEAIEHEANSNPYPRAYLGASAIGHECSRKLWYNFRHASFEYINHKSQKRFDDGHHSEAVYIKRIKQAGYSLQHDMDGKQYGFKDFGGWFRGHRDGKLFDIPDIGDAIWEHKSSSKWKGLNKAIDKHGEDNALEQWNKTYYDQAQLYMGYEGVKWHILTCSSEGSREESIVLTPFNEDAFNAIKHKANYIITTDTPPAKISDNPTFFKCGWCDAKEVCHQKKIPKPNCRNCAHVTFITDNADQDNPIAHCAANNVNIPSTDAMINFYACHRFNPCFIDADCLGLDDGDVLYRTEDGKEFVNGSKGFSSMQMHESQDSKLWLDQNVKHIMDVFSAVPIQVSN